MKRSDFISSTPCAGSYCEPNYKEQSHLRLRGFIYRLKQWWWWWPLSILSSECVLKCPPYHNECERQITKSVKWIPQSFRHSMPENQTLFVFWYASESKLLHQDMKFSLDAGSYRCLNYIWKSHSYRTCIQLY